MQCFVLCNIFDDFHQACALTSSCTDTCTTLAPLPPMQVVFPSLQEPNVHIEIAPTLRWSTNLHKAFFSKHSRFSL